MNAWQVPRASNGWCREPELPTLPSCPERLREPPGQKQESSRRTRFLQARWLGRSASEVESCERWEQAGAGLVRVAVPS